MSRLSLLRCGALLAGLGLIAGSASVSAQNDNSRRGRKYKAPPPTARIEVTVLKADNGKPIQDAHVIFHPIEGDKDKGSMEVKTNEDGTISLGIIPIGDTVRLQIIADGFQTYGQDYQVDRPKLSWEVCLRRPGPQYSIYTHHPTSMGDSACPENISHQKPAEGSGSGSSEGADKPAGSPQTASPPSAEKTSADQASPSQPQPN